MRYGLVMASIMTLATPAAVGDLPPLDPAESSTLAETRDDTDVPDTSFQMLADHVRQWDDQVRDEPIRMRLPLERLLDTPAAVRGELYRVQGKLLERRSMVPPYGDIQEWFLRLPTGEPLVVYLPAQGVPEAIKTGRPVTVDARFYKVLQAEARDGQVRRYPAFFGAAPRAILSQRAAVLQRMDVLVLLGFLLLLVIVLLAVLVLARKQLPPRRRLELGSVERRPDMPDDPAAALRELRDRAQEGDRS